jgi:urease accessory protein
MHAALLLLTDGRLPSGAHAHSGGLEQVAVDGRVRSVEDVGLFARGVLEGAGGTAAALAATACALASAPAARGETPPWDLLCAEAWARQPSAAARRASEAQGRALLRTGRRVWPGTLLETLAAGSLRPPLPVVLGAVAAAAGLSPRDAALASLHGQVSGVASAAVRLLGLDPIEVAAALATLTPTLDRLAHDAAACATTDPGRLRLLPATTGPLLDVLAERHDAREMTLFAS